MFGRIFFVGLVVFLAACGSPDTPKDETSSSGTVPNKPPVSKIETGTIVGEVKFAGVPPVSKRIVVNKDQEACGEFKDSEELVVGADRGIKWAVVSLNFQPMEMRWEGTELNQARCQFYPHVRLIPAGSKLKILNPDGVLHNFHSQSAANPSINKAQPKFKKTMEVSFAKPETFRISCDAHGWMKGWIVVMGHPYYAVTDEKGGFKFEDVPVGKQVLKIWHEDLGEVLKEVEVRANKTANIIIDMKK